MKSLKDANALVVGANCSIGSDRMVLPAKEVRKTVSTTVMAAPLKKFQTDQGGLEALYPYAAFSGD